MAAHSSILAWRIPWTKEADRLQSVGVTKSRTELRELADRKIVQIHCCLHQWPDDTFGLSIQECLLLAGQLDPSSLNSDVVTLPGIFRDRRLQL